jgi:hypothetical protein
LAARPACTKGRRSERFASVCDPCKVLVGVVLGQARLLVTLLPLELLLRPAADADRRSLVARVDGMEHDLLQSGWPGSSRRVSCQAKFPSRSRSRRNSSMRMCSGWVSMASFSSWCRGAWKSRCKAQRPSDSRATAIRCSSERRRSPTVVSVVRMPWSRTSRSTSVVALSGPCSASMPRIVPSSLSSVIVAGSVAAGAAARDGPRGDEG